MSVQFHEKGFAINVFTNMNPAETWLETTEELIDILKSSNPDLSESINHRNVLEVLRSMMPDLEMVKKMTK